jgi:hypothetical protein
MYQCTMTDIVIEKQIKGQRRNWCQKVEYIFLFSNWQQNFVKENCWENIRLLYISLYIFSVHSFHLVLHFLIILSFIIHLSIFVLPFFLIFFNFIFCQRHQSLTFTNSWKKGVKLPNFRLLHFSRFMKQQTSWKQIKSKSYHTILIILTLSLVHFQ